MVGKELNSSARFTFTDVASMIMETAIPSEIRRSRRKAGMGTIMMARIAMIPTPIKTSGLFPSLENAELPDDWDDWPAA
jgi:hypothetical protein